MPTTLISILQDTEGGGGGSGLEGAPTLEGTELRTPAEQPCPGPNRSTPTPTSLLG